MKMGTEKAIADIETRWLRVVMTVMMVVIMLIPFIVCASFTVVYDSLLCIAESFHD